MVDIAQQLTFILMNNERNQSYQWVHGFLNKKPILELKPENIPPEILKYPVNVLKAILGISLLTSRSATQVSDPPLHHTTTTPSNKLLHKMRVTTWI